MKFFTTSLCSVFNLFLLIKTVNSANILFYHNIASYSHRVATYPLADALAKRGHHVTFLNPFHHRGPYINPNITEIVPRNVEKIMTDFLDGDFDIDNRIHKLFPRMVYAFYPIALKTCDKLLTTPEFQRYLNTTKKLDLVIMDNCMADCGVALAYKYRAKHIFFNTVVHIPNEFDWYGFSPETSAIPEHEIDPPQTPMTFLERVFNTLISIHFRWIHYSYVQEVDKLVRKYMDVPSMPFLDNVARNASLVFYTGDVVSDYPRSHPPFVVNVGGIYCHQYPVNESSIHQGLSRDLQKFIEEDDLSSDGFIYISLGSLVLPSTLPTHMRHMFFSMMRTFPKLRFLWKWDSNNFPRDVPGNLYLGQWFPQRHILAHPKIRGFIMQGGRPSTIEALCHGVPMTALPVLGDQDVNSKRLNNVGGNVLLEWGTLRQEQLEDAVRKMAYDSGMKQNMAKLQNILLDKPMSALETAVWWTEYVLRHNDTNFLRSASFDQWWFQRRLLDVWAFIFIIILVIFSALLSLFLACAKYLTRRLNHRQRDETEVVLKKRE